MSKGRLRNSDVIEKEKLIAERDETANKLKPTVQTGCLMKN